MGASRVLTATPDRRGSKFHDYRFNISPTSILIVFSLILMSFMMSSAAYVGRAENFTDIFYTNSFRGAFSWIQKLDWVGMIVQCVISCFSLFGVALMTVRIMTSMLYLSSRGLWEEVHDLKQSGGESELYDFGLINMAKSWVKGKAGTGLDAIIGAVLILLPDVKKYSDFGEKASGDFDSTMSVSQYILKIIIPTVMTTFFFAMGFNGTLFHALAETVDFLGSIADTAISINYAGFVEDLANSGTGFKFAFKNSNTNLGNLQQNIARDIYGRLVTEIRGADAEMLDALGQNVNEWVTKNITIDLISQSPQISENVREKLAGSGTGDPDSYVPYLGYDIVINSSAEATGEFLGNEGKALQVPEWFTYKVQVPRVQDGYEELQAKYFHIFIRQTSSYNGTYFNLDGTAGNGMGNTTQSP